MKVKVCCLRKTCTVLSKPSTGDALKLNKKNTSYEANGTVHVGPYILFKDIYI